MSAVPEELDDSPAARYARARRSATDRLGEFAASLPFAMDAFQRDACRALQSGSGVLVAAPTGSGKTVVGEFAVHLALAGGTKCFYTTPIKALSNQKYTDLVARYGDGAVGLLTGDSSINGDAPVVVMTTEVLRNMLYAGSPTLDRLGFVVMDEVHYLADRARGVVWEEVIIHLPPTVQMVALSATVSNVEEFGAWLGEVRGDTELVVSEHRPVPLHQHVLVDDHLVDLFARPLAAPTVPTVPTVGTAAPATPAVGTAAPATGSTAPSTNAVGQPAVVNPRLVRLAGDEVRQQRTADRGGRHGPRHRGGYGRGGQAGRGGSGRSGPRRSSHTPDRVDVVERLEASALLPAIVFVFSRAGCDAAVSQLRGARVRLTNAAERARIREYAERRCAVIPDEDLHILGYHDWLDSLEDGVAAHHAGVLPTLKEVVEQLFAEGLVKVVFATETLALGINMPARSVVLERLVKWNGDTHADITAGEYTQLTGRAGRRGIDVAGHAVVLWQSGLDPAAVAGLAATRTYPLRSSFRPGYGMAANLVRRSGRAQARVLLESSFAQFQADRDVLGLVRRIRRNEQALAGYAESAHCHLGDLLEYARLRARVDTLSTAVDSRRVAGRRSAVLDSLASLRAGEIIVVPGGKHPGPVIVLDPDVTPDRPRSGADAVLRPIGGDPRPLVLGLDRQVRRLTAAQFQRAVVAVTAVRMPRGFDARDTRARRDLVAAAREALAGASPAAPAGAPASDPAPAGGPAQSGGSAQSGDLAPAVDAAPSGEAELTAARRAVSSHPCHGCADRDAHLRWATRYDRLLADTEQLRERVGSRTGTIARTFDRVCRVLDRLGYLDGDQLTEDGALLLDVYAELDLLVAQCLRRGIWSGLDPAQLAACLSALTYTARREDDAPARVPDQAVRDALQLTGDAWSELVSLEREVRIPAQREPDPGFAWLSWRWASGASLDDVLTESGVSAGDFIRQIKQVLDLADQVMTAADRRGQTDLASTARAAIGALRRGVVAYASTVGD